MILYSLNNEVNQINKNIKFFGIISIILSLKKKRGGGGVTNRENKEKRVHKNIIRIQMLVCKILNL